MVPIDYIENINCNLNPQLELARAKWLKGDQPILIPMYNTNDRGRFCSLLAIRENILSDIPLSNEANVLIISSNSNGDI